MEQKGKGREFKSKTECVDDNRPPRWAFLLSYCPIQHSHSGEVRVVRGVSEVQ